MPTNILIVGGAGYIGAHMVACAKQAGYTPIVLDNLSTGHAEAVLEAKLIVGDMNDQALLRKLFLEYDFAAVMHFASCIAVGESVVNPQKYYLNNVMATLQLLEVMLESGCDQFIFSSSAAVYGEPNDVPIRESHALNPVNAYGRSKRMIEEVLLDYSQAYGLKYCALRYFNAAGADAALGLRERHQPETHLIPLLLLAAENGMDFSIYGSDYETLDGTCVRDYIHVMDICDAHLRALEYLREGGSSLICNLGTGKGFSVKAVLDAVVAVTGKNIAAHYCGRRVGDPAVLVADASLAFKKLNWLPKRSELSTILMDAWGCSLKAF